MNSKDVILESTEKVQTIYFFQKDKRTTGCDLLDGKVVYENPKTLLPMLKDGTGNYNKLSNKKKEVSIKTTKKEIKTNQNP